MDVIRSLLTNTYIGRNLCILSFSMNFDTRNPFSSHIVSIVLLVSGDTLISSIALFKEESI